MLIHVTMLFVVVYLIYHILVTLGYVTLLKEGLLASADPEIRQQIKPCNIQTFNKLNKVAEDEYVVWKTIWLPVLFATTANVLWLWVLFGFSAEINSTYLAFSVVVISGLLTRMHVKNFFAEWIGVWFTSLEWAQRIVLLNKLNQRLADIKATLEKIANGEIQVSRAEFESLKVEVIQIVQVIAGTNASHHDITTVRID